MLLREPGGTRHVQSRPDTSSQQSLLLSSSSTTGSRPTSGTYEDGESSTEDGEEENDGSVRQEDESQLGVHYFPDGHFWIEVPGIPDSDNEEDPDSTRVVKANHSGMPITQSTPKKRDRVRFSRDPIKVYSTFSVSEYDRRNEEVDPVSASAEYELEKRVEKMEVFPVELVKGPEGLGLSIIGMGVGADAGLEKLGIFVKTITEGGAAHRDCRINVNDQIIEVDGKSLVGVTQAYAASVLRNTSGLVKFLIGREKDSENSEVAQLISQSLAADREREERRFAVEQELQQRKKILQHQNEESQGGREQPATLSREDLTLPLGRTTSPPSPAPEPISGTQGDSTPEEGEDLPTCEVFDLEEESSESPSPDDLTTIKIKMKEAQYKSAVAEAELAKIKARLIGLETQTTSKEECERRLAETSRRLAEVELTLESVRKEVLAYQDMLEESQGQYIVLEKKYYKAKKLIREFHQREQDLNHREEFHIQQLQEKDQEYNALVKALKDRVIQLEQGLMEAQRVAGLPVRLPYDNTKLQLTPQQARKPNSLPTKPASCVRRLDADMSDTELSDADLSKYDISPDSDEADSKTSTVERKLPVQQLLKGSDLFEKAVPQTELLDSSAAKTKAELASKGSLANRQPPSLKKTPSTGSSGSTPPMDRKNSSDGISINSNEDLDESYEGGIEKASTPVSTSSDSVFSPLSASTTTSPHKDQPPSRPLSTSILPSAANGVSASSKSPDTSSVPSSGHKDSLSPGNRATSTWSSSLHQRSPVSPVSATQAGPTTPPTSAAAVQSSRDSLTFVTPLRITDKFAEEMRMVIQKMNSDAGITSDPVSSNPSNPSPSPVSTASSRSATSESGVVLLSQKPLESSLPRVLPRRDDVAISSKSTTCKPMVAAGCGHSESEEVGCCGRGWTGCCLPRSPSEEEDLGIKQRCTGTDGSMDRGMERSQIPVSRSQPSIGHGFPQDGNEGQTSAGERKPHQWQSGPVSGWSSAQVGQWLLALGFEQYITPFVEAGINGLELVHLDSGRLKGLGVVNSSDRSAIKKKLKDLKIQMEKERKAQEKELRAKEKLQKKADKAGKRK